MLELDFILDTATCFTTVLGIRRAIYVRADFIVIALMFTLLAMQQIRRRVVWKLKCMSLLYVRWRKLSLITHRRCFSSSILRYKPSSVYLVSLTHLVVLLAMFSISVVPLCVLSQASRVVPWILPDLVSRHGNVTQDSCSNGTDSVLKSR